MRCSRKRTLFFQTENISIGKGRWKMEDDDSGQSHFLPHIFFPDVAFSQWPHYNAVDPQSSVKNSHNVMLWHYKMYCHVEKCPPIVLFRPTAARPLPYPNGIWFHVPHGKFLLWMNAVNGRLPPVSVYLQIHCWSLKCSGALLCVEVYVILNGLMWNVYVPERLCGQHAIKGRIQYQDMIYMYIYCI